MKATKQEVVKKKTEADYIQAEHDLSQALGLKPKKFDRSATAPGSIVTGTWLDRDGTPLRAWVRDGAATLSVMAKFQCYPSASTMLDEVYIQSGIDLDYVSVPVAEHADYESAVRYAVALAATSIASFKPNVK